MAIARNPTRSTLPGERALILAIAAQAAAADQGSRPRSSARNSLRVGIGDDCAVLRVPAGHELAVTTDLLLENTHFRRDWHTPESAGHRCLARGLSDLAATGARPLAAFLSLSLPPELAGRWAPRFLAGLLALARAHGVPLAGGDTAQAPSAAGQALFTADICLLGSVPTGAALLRSTARRGDLLYVTGALGGAAAELASLQAARSVLRKLRTPGSDNPQLFPRPRVAQGLRLRSLATAAIDLSDGLSTDLAHLCAASGLHAEVDLARLPVHPLAQSTAHPLRLALDGGEDYELLFTASPDTHVPRSVAGVPVRAVGRMVPARKGAAPVTAITADGTRTPLRNGGWQHFRA